MNIFQDPIHSAFLKTIKGRVKKAHRKVDELTILAHAEGYAAGLEAAAQLLEKGWVEDSTYWVANELTNRAAKAIRALGEEEGIRKPAGKQD